MDNTCKLVMFERTFATFKVLECKDYQRPPKYFRIDEFTVVPGFPKDDHLELTLVSVKNDGTREEIMRAVECEDE